MEWIWQTFHILDILLRLAGQDWKYFHNFKILLHLVGQHFQIFHMFKILLRLVGQDWKYLKKIKMLKLLVKNWKLLVWCSFIHLYHVTRKISNFNMWTAKHLAQASCTELTLFTYFYYLSIGLISVPVIYLCIITFFIGFVSIVFHRGSFIIFFVKNESI